MANGDWKRRNGPFGSVPAPSFADAKQAKVKEKKPFSKITPAPVPVAVSSARSPSASANPYADFQHDLAAPSGVSDPKEQQRKDTLLTRGWNFLWSPLAGKSYAQGWSNPSWEPPWERKLDVKLESTGSPALAVAIGAPADVLARAEGVAASLTSPGSLALMALTLGDSVLGKVVQAGAEAGVEAATEETAGRTALRAAPRAIRTFRGISSATRAATGAFFGVQGTLVAAGRGLGALRKDITPEQRAEYASQALSGASMALFAGAGLKDQINGGIRTVLRKSFRLDDDLASKISSKVADVEAAKASRAAAEASKRSFSSGASAYEARVATEIRQGEDALKANMDRIEQETKSSLTSLSQEIKERGERIADGQKAAEAMRTRTGSHLLADSVQGILEEHDRVSEPFKEMAKKAGDKPVMSEEEARGLLDDEAAKFGVQEKEIPAKAFESLPATGGRLPQGPGSSSENGGALLARQLLTKDNLEPREVRGILRGQGFAPQQIDRMMSMAVAGEEAAGASLDFGNVTRFRQDLWQAAETARDMTVRAFLLSALDRANEKQEKFADDEGFGAEFRKAKGEFTRFIRSFGPDSEMAKFVAASRDKEQDMEGKMARLLRPVEGRVLRSAFRALGLDHSDFDRSLEAMKEFEKEKKLLPKEEAARAKAIQEAGKTAKEQLEEEAGRKQEELRSSVKEAREQAKAGTETAEKQIAEAVAREKLAEEAGGEIVPRMTTSDLADMTQKQLEAERIRGMMDQMKKVGITNPWRLALAGIGLVRLAMGSAWGMFEIAIGVTPMLLDRMVHSPRFQDHVIEMAGAEDAPPRTQSAIRNWLNDLGPELRRLARTQIPTPLGRPSSISVAPASPSGANAVPSMLPAGNPYAEFMVPQGPEDNSAPSLVRAAAIRYGVPPDLALAVGSHESGFRQSAVSPKGARGVMQLMPRTAKGLGVNPLRKTENIDGGVRYLGEMLSRFGGDRRASLAAYDAGPERVLRAGWPNPGWLGRMPEETRNYVRDIEGRLGQTIPPAPPASAISQAPVLASPTP